MPIFAAMHNRRNMLTRFILYSLFLSATLSAQTPPNAHPPITRPKLVVGIVIDQMRWDYLYRYYDRYTADGGFRRLINRGFSCENTFINYLPSYTACGHTGIYTGSVPAIHGITGNDWYDRQRGKEVYCSDDDTARGVGTSSSAGKKSPANLQVTTIGDELRLATNFRGKVVGIALKDRASIFPAGHLANAAYWFEGASGNFISSSHYLQQLPPWVTAFNAKKLPAAYLKKGWNTLYPPNTYAQSTADEQPYEDRPFGERAQGFPYRLDTLAKKNEDIIASTPYGNSLTKDMAMAAISGEQLGLDTVTDLLAIGFSSTDYIGHEFGPNSMEIEDAYLRLDKDLGDLFRFLDAQVGEGQYLVFVSADHGVAHAPGFEAEHGLPGGATDGEMMGRKLDSSLKKVFGNHAFILDQTNNQVVLDHHLIDSLKTDGAALRQWIIQYFSAQPAVARAFNINDVMTIPLPAEIRTRVSNSYYPSRSGDIQIIMKPGWMTEGGRGTTHGSWNPYDTHIPLIWYGWSIKPGQTNRETYMTDIAATVAALLHIQMPSGCIGKVISELN